MGKIRKHLLSGAALCLLLCCGCGQEEPSVPTEVLDFDLDTAAAMVDEVEWLCTWLQTQDTLSRDTAESFVAQDTARSQKSSSRRHSIFRKA